MGLSWLQLCALLLLLSFVSSQEDTEKSLSEILTPSVFPAPNEALASLYPASIFFAETAITIRYNMLVVISRFEVSNACSPKSLSFLGIRDPMPSHFCDADSIAIATSYITAHLLRSEFRTEYAGFAKFLTRNGLKPEDTSRNLSAIEGRANVMADRLIKYFSNDGWNSQGDMTSDFYRMQFSDPTGYSPANSPSLCPNELVNPLRWQAVSFSKGPGFYGFQKHVVPHIGKTVRPLVLSQQDYLSYVAPPLYANPNSEKAVGKEDAGLVRKLIAELLERIRGLTREKIAEIYLWDNKFAGLGMFRRSIRRQIGYDERTDVLITTGEVLAQHDALLLAWKEKRRHDLARPQTVIRYMLGDEEVEAYGIDGKVGKVNAQEWRSVVQTQPHSEYPSASAVICQATVDAIEHGLRRLVLGNNTIPKVSLGANAETLPGLPLEGDVEIRFDSLQQAAARCGESRLDSGVHFRPAVEAGMVLGRGLGTAAARHVADLAAGVVPKNCDRC